jgi:hypothetical protein
MSKVCDCRGHENHDNANIDKLICDECGTPLVIQEYNIYPMGVKNPVCTDCWEEWRNNR